MRNIVCSSRIRWVFLDVGNVLFNDDPLMAVVYRRMWEAIRRRRPAFSFSSLMAERERLIETWEYKHYSILARRYLSEGEWASLHLGRCAHPPLPGKPSAGQPLSGPAALNSRAAGSNHPLSERPAPRPGGPLQLSRSIRPWISL